MPEETGGQPLYEFASNIEEITNSDPSNGQYNRVDPIKFEPFDSYQQQSMWP